MIAVRVEQSVVGTAGRPLIGISGHIGVAKAGMRATFVPQTYVDGVTRAGCLPVLLPPVPDIELTLGQLDGLMLIGGPDADPALYSAPRDPRTGEQDAGRDTAELALIDAALAAGLPLLGICRGPQLLNIHCGGTLHQHLPDVLGHDGHLVRQGQYAPQRVHTRPGSLLAHILGDEVVVPCHHHQGIDRLGAGLIVTGHAADGAVEAVEFADHPFALGVQWHPEEGDDTRLFLALAEAAGATAPAASLTPGRRRA